MSYTSDTPGYGSWTAMKTRCQNPNSHGYKWYGARGVRVCGRWQRFKEFWADMGPTWFPGATLDRVDPAMDYFPENCRWVEMAEQSRNRRGVFCRVIQTPVGALRLFEASAVSGLDRKTLSCRIAAGWPVEMLFCKPNEIRRWDVRPGKGG